MSIADFVVYEVQVTPPQTSSTLVGNVGLGGSRPPLRQTAMVLVAQAAPRKGKLQLI